MDAYPDWKELAKNGIPLTACQFPSCPVECKNFKQLLDHIKKRHLDIPCQIMHHWVHEMALHERNPQGLGQGERGHVELVWSSGGQVDEDQVCGFEKPVREGAGQVGRPPNLFRQKGGLARTSTGMTAEPRHPIARAACLHVCSDCRLARPRAGSAPPMQPAQLGSARSLARYAARRSARAAFWGT